MLINDFTEDGTPIAQLTNGSERLVRLCCDGCGKVSTTTWSNYLQGQRVRKETAGKTYCQPCSARIGGLNRVGRPAPAVALANASRVREKHACWRGGRYVDNSGYVMVLVGKRQRGSGWGSYRKEHIVVMEQTLGRKLRPEEVIHHVDNNKQNNVLSNLFLTDQQGHRLAHVSLNLAYSLLRAALLVPTRSRATIENTWQAYRDGKITFDATQGIYVANLKLRELLEPPTG